MVPVAEQISKSALGQRPRLFWVWDVCVQQFEHNQRSFTVLMRPGMASCNPSWNQITVCLLVRCKLSSLPTFNFCFVRLNSKHVIKSLMGTASSHCGCHCLTGPFLKLRVYLCWVPVGPKHKWLSWVKCFKACVILWYCGWKQKRFVLGPLGLKTLARFQSTFVDSLVGICCDFVLCVLSLAQREIDFEFLVALRSFCSCVLSLSNVDLFRMLCHSCNTKILWVRFQNVSNICETHFCVKCVSLAHSNTLQNSFLLSVKSLSGLKSV